MGPSLWISLSLLLGFVIHTRQAHGAEDLYYVSVARCRIQCIKKVSTEVYLAKIPPGVTVHGVRHQVELFPFTLYAQQDYHTKPTLISLIFLTIWPPC